MNPRQSRVGKFYISNSEGKRTIRKSYSSRTDQDFKEPFGQVTLQVFEMSAEGASHDDSSSKVEGNIGFQRGIPLNSRITGEVFDPPESLIPSLAEAARPKDVIPVAGSYAIENGLPNGITAEIPPSSMVNEGANFPFSLESMVDTGIPDIVTRNIPKELLESEGDKSYVFTPLEKLPAAKPEPNSNQVLDADVTKRFDEMKVVAANAAVAEEEQRKLKAATTAQKEQAKLFPGDKSKPTMSGSGGSRSRSSSKGKTNPPPPNPKPNKMKNSTSSK